MIVKNKVESLQIIRAFAAVLVTICHIWNDGWLPIEFTNLGGFGVDLFFVLSGFIMCLTVKLNIGSKYLNAKYFLNKRIIRIFPIYILCAFPLLLFNIKAEGIKSSFFYIGNLFLLPSFNNDVNYAFVLGTGWTLAYEMLFYYIFAFFILITGSKFRLLVLSSIFLCSLVLIVNVFGFKGGQLRWVNFSYIIGDTLLLNFVLGIICYFIYIELKDRIFLNYFHSLLLLAILSVLAAYLNTLDSLPRIISFGLPAFVIVSFFTLTRNNLNNSWLLKKIVFIGDASYSIYLTHFYFAFFKPKVLLVAKHIDLEFNVLINIIDVLLLVGAVACGCLFYIIIEKPIIKYTSRGVIAR
ncbi:acyltransferase family protein [Pedobacter antarcticus]|uniref:acyltransferase family protein n=1 Tax=Pedobacter antarcticus TaxID=34086 RepID=UPI000886AAE8|nr:acyltransferase [Pedobacter antarcticus]SDL39816.1 Peptidoglycan/LPS O-acetylase OafA/YrhL, contains acyltransferase and SGNH-hydrolase domains [Pedobacter antarcticus]